MATQTAIFDLYYILVELIFGHIIWTWLGLCVIFLAIGMFTRISFKSVLYILFVFSFALLAPVSAIFSFIIFFIAFGYFSFQVIMWIKGAA